MSEQHLKAVAFPTLDEAQMAALGRCPLTTLKRYRDEEKLFEACERDFKFFVVKSGKVEIMDESGETPNTVTVHGPGEFTGDVAQLSGSPSLVGGVARGDCRLPGWTCRRTRRWTSSSRNSGSPKRTRRWSPGAASCSCATLLETSHPGVFAAGDVRSGSVKRVASSVGEGAMAVQFVHEYLKEM